MLATSNAMRVALLPDNRTIARDWIQDNIPEGTRIALDWEYTPHLLTDEYKDELLNGRSAKFFQHYFATHEGGRRTYQTLDFEPSIEKIKVLEADYLVISSGCYERFFTSIPPPEGTAMRREYYERQEAYALLLHSPEAAGWTAAADVNSGIGPQIRIYRRLHPPDGNS